uniref:Immunoglobulin V-set domain-containing protein n=1 Tax=Seriola lalandi dorsalis TaxID=1841481 RepID=A0A3B4YII1_SERLL
MASGQLGQRGELLLIARPPLQRIANGGDAAHLEIFLYLLWAGVTVTQSGAVTSALGASVTITFGSDLQWYLQKPREAPKLLIYSDTTRYSGVPDCFSGSLSHGTDFTLSVGRNQTEHAGVYYCQQSEALPFTQ